MANGLLWTFIVLNVLFAGGGALILVVAITTDADIKGKQTIDNVATDLLLNSTPLEAGIINAIFIFITFLLSFPGMLSPTKRTFLRIHGWMVVLSALFTMTLGLDIWFETLKTRSNLVSVWASQPASTQSLLQQKFNCCGYTNLTSPPFITDATCTNPLVAADLGGCVGPFALFANHFLAIVFTADFGIVGLNIMLLLTIACVLKVRKEQERYRFIDQKNGVAI